MSIQGSPNITQVLLAWRNGDSAALAELMPMVYDEMRRLAAGHLNRERPNHTLQPTALVNEVYLQLVDQRQVNWQSRAHFFGAVAEIMRRLLVDHARKHQAEKRGGGAFKVSLGDLAVVLEGENDLEVILLDQALDELAALDPPLARLVELRYFGGLSVEETAEVLAASPATVKRHWQTARAWLRQRMTGGMTNE
ncbi:MAG TPA: sigma-70 family RNA polymerase sigma factor [Blastocatellia bacterium]|nr:sigma-70 family RNA polymerase sigma factor [Blastocatellia bacterium]HMY73937.1 sigma-70 family RNA polymerase sigma factor [Blastocatellia bacterium]HMZ20685.1 sigma-70 family RNA polymerase sigma factor [Blastocatellia bacterium]HNG34498.1 sigma-70 family RNA polymerase sigma factor [Blastocatellia bacterium]